MKLIFTLSNYLLLLLTGLTLVFFFIQPGNEKGLFSSAPFLVLWGLLFSSSAVLLAAGMAGRRLAWPVAFIHLSLLLFVAGLLVRGRDAEAGEIALQPASMVAWNGMTIGLDEFGIPVNPDGSPSQYVSHLTVDGRKRVVSVNHPLFLGGRILYQKAFREKAVSFSLLVSDKKGGQTRKTGVVLGEKSALAGGRTLECDAFFPDFFLDEGDVPGTRSAELLNPILHYRITGTGGVLIEQGYAFPEDLGTMHYPRNQYAVTMTELSVERTSVLGYASTAGLLLMLIASVLFFLGCLARFAPSRRERNPR